MKSLLNITVLLMLLSFADRCLAQDKDTFEKKNKQRIAYNDSINKVLEWKQIEDNLYINKNGEFGIWAFRLLNPPDEGYVYYQTCLWDEKKHL